MIEKNLALLKIKMYIYLEEMSAKSYMRNNFPIYDKYIFTHKVIYILYDFLYQIPAKFLYVGKKSAPFFYLCKKARPTRVKG